nr:ABC transporter permease [Nocardioides luti]
MASAGGTPPQTRRVVLAGAVVLGGVASVLGVVVGIGLGRALVPLLQQRSGSWFGPFEVPWLHLLGVAGFGLLSALLAAVVPATIASRQDVVAVLAGRRGDRKPSLRSPILGTVLLGLGVAGAAVGSRSSDVNGAYFIAGAAISSVLGMVLLVPLVLVLVSRLSSALPLTLRYAARDAARHRTRTVPAVAAVAATVAGVVALGIALASDEAQNEAEYTPSFASGVGVVTGAGDYATYARLVQREIPGATVTPVLGVPYPDGGFRDVSITTAGSDREALLTSYGASFGSDVLVSDGALPTGLLGLDTASRRAAEAALADGRSVVFTDTGVAADEARIAVTTFKASSKKAGPAVRERLPVVTVPVSVGAGPQAILSADAAAALDLPVAPVGLTVSGTSLTKADESAVTEALAGSSEAASFTVERGYQADSATVITQLVLAGLGAVLMLGGTLTATFLALSDARPDLATLSAIGASPRRRRGIAAAYAVVVGMVGALLGVVVGFIPGIAITYPLTSTGGDTCSVASGSGYCEATGVSSGPFLDIPWLLILGLVVVLPLLTALVVGAAVRSRLPLVARLV